MRTHWAFAAAASAAMLSAAPASADVMATSESGFITRDEAVVDATTKEVWLALITPSIWWNSAHTWSGDSANLSMRPQAGGCFCERIPEDPNTDRITLEGSVEHMRIVQAFPEKALRMTGGLGPLQSEAVQGVLTIVLSEDDQGTRIVWEYVVGGPMRYEVDVISKAVDGVMTQQLTGLATELGPISGAGASKPIEAVESEEPASEGESEPVAESDEGEATEAEDAISEVGLDAGSAGDTRDVEAGDEAVEESEGEVFESDELPINDDPVIEAENALGTSVESGAYPDDTNNADGADAGPDVDLETLSVEEALDRLLDKTPD